jgi:hypothetical protein
MINEQSRHNTGVIQQLRKQLCGWLAHRDQRRKKAGPHIVSFDLPHARLFRFIPV